MSTMYDLLITPKELEALLGKENFCLFDCRHSLTKPDQGQRLYEAGHIPGARFAHTDHDLSDPPGPEHGRHPLPDWQRFCHWLEDKGVTEKSQVVAYDDAGGVFASRLWWLLTALGHEQVAILDGGLQAWQAAGLPLQTDTPASTRGDFTAQPDARQIATLDEVGAMLGEKNLRLIDARGKNRYEGIEEPLDPRAGHIPGALNLPFTENLNPDQTFLSPEVLKQKWQNLLGDTPPGAAIHYCGSGVSACHNLFTQKLAGLPIGRLYAGSWSQWCADPNRPIATGPNP